MGVKIMVLRIGDINWAYSDKTGVVPFILNEKKTRVKQLEDGFVLEILDRNKNSNPTLAGLSTLGDYYDVEMQSLTYADVLEPVSFVQKVQHFGLKRVNYSMPVNMEQIEFLTANYNAAMVAEGRRRAQQEIEDLDYQEAYVKTFNF